MRDYWLLDLFCGEGGASVGYANAGFKVIGIDIAKMDKYPFVFYQGDALTLDDSYLLNFDAIHASPPCKVHTRLKAFSDPSHIDLIPQTREKLKKSGKLYVIENVPDAPLINPMMLCGSMWDDIYIRRHRIFESNIKLVAPGPCRHAYQEQNSPGFLNQRTVGGVKVVRTSPVITVAGRGQGAGKGEAALWRKYMRMPWAGKEGLREAIPPYYTEWIGHQLMTVLTSKS